MALTKKEIEQRVSDSYEVPNRVLEVVENPIVTVRTSTYNHGPFIRECLEGVLKQQTSFPFEFIIGEDFSTDETRGIVMEYAEKYPDVIRVMTADYNVGMSANGRRCIQASRGKYMALCEGDDYWTDPLKLQKQVDFLERNPGYSLCSHRYKILDENDEISTDGNEQFFIEDKSVDVSLETYLDPYLLKTCCLVFRRSHLPEAYYKNPGGDIVTMAYLLSNGPGAVFTDLMAVYRKHPGGVYSLVSEIEKVRRRYRDARVMHEVLAGDSQGIKVFAERTKNQLIHLSLANSSHSIMEGRSSYLEYKSALEDGDEISFDEVQVHQDLCGLVRCFTATFVVIKKDLFRLIFKRRTYSHVGAKSFVLLIALFPAMLCAAVLERFADQIKGG